MGPTTWFSSNNVGQIFEFCLRYFMANHLKYTANINQTRQIGSSFINYILRDVFLQLQVYERRIAWLLGGS
jgi:hypothetical protein